MKTKKRPELGAVILMYICAIGTFMLYGPSAYFYLNKCEVQGEVVEIELLIKRVKYYDNSKNEYLALTEEAYRKGKLEIGQIVTVYYRKDNPTDVHVPDFDGNEPYFLYFFYLLMALVAVFVMHRDYLKFK